MIMKKVLLMMTGLVMAGTAWADWSDRMGNPTPIFPAGTGSYAIEVAVGDDGDIWAVNYHPNLKDADDEYDIEHVVYEYRLQHFDKNGNPLFPEDGILISDYANKSYTVVSNYIHVDSEGNCIVAVSDQRNASDRECSVTAYKVSPTGEQLWGEDGVAVSDAMHPVGYVACMRLVEMDDHSIVFAWQESDGQDTNNVCLQRISKDGKAQWGTSKIWNEGQTCTYPYLVPSEDNTCILVYARTESAILYAVKLDFECESVWGKEVRVYRGGWGSVPLWTQLEVKSSGDGGALIAWSDDRAGTNIESPYISYVTSDGELGFEGVSDESDCKLYYGEDGVRSLGVTAAPASDGSGFVAMWRLVGGGNQSYQGIMAQKVSKSGELLWGDEAVTIFPIDVASYGYMSCQPTTDGGMMGFYEQYFAWNDQQCLAVRLDKDGDFVWKDGSMALSKEGRQSTSLKSQLLPVPGAYLIDWTDEETVGTGDDAKKVTTYVMDRFNEDGTFGDSSTAVTSVESDSADLVFDGAMLLSSLADGTQVNVFDATGARVAGYTLAAGRAEVSLPAGLYMASVPGKASVKFIVK